MKPHLHTLNTLAATFMTLLLAVPAAAQQRDTVNITVKLILYGDAPRAESHALVFKHGVAARSTSSRFCGPDLPPERPACEAFIGGLTYPKTIKTPRGTTVAFTLQRSSSRDGEPSTADVYARGAMTINGDTTISAFYDYKTGRARQRSTGPASRASPR